MRYATAALLAGLPLGAQSMPARAQPAPAVLFARQCGTCHIAKPANETRQGPNLWGIIGRPAGAVPGFRYSASYATSGITWDEASLDAYLANPQALIAGSTMAYRQANPDTRRTIIEWLKDQN